MRGFRALGSLPPMSSRHRNLEPLGRWHATIYLLEIVNLFSIFGQYTHPMASGRSQWAAAEYINFLCLRVHIGIHLKVE